MTKTPRPARAPRLGSCRIGLDIRIRERAEGLVGYGAARCAVTRPADRLRSLLRAAGISSRAATVRERDCSLETSLTVTVRSVHVPMAALRSCVAQVKDVRWDPVVGDVLGGGNTFVHVRWLDAVEQPIREAFTAEALAADDAVTWGFEHRGYKFTRSSGQTTAWRDGSVVGVAYGYDADAVRLLCVNVVRDLLERGEGVGFVVETAEARTVAA